MPNPKGASWCRNIHDAPEPITALREPCGCLCPLHMDATGSICGHHSTKIVTLVGGYVSPNTMLMCAPCGTWWHDHRSIINVPLPDQIGGNP